MIQENKHFLNEAGNGALSLAPDWPINTFFFSISQVSGLGWSWGQAKRILQQYPNKAWAEFSYGNSGSVRSLLYPELCYYVLVSTKAKNTELPDRTGSSCG